MVEADEYEPTAGVRDSLHIHGKLRLAAPVVVCTMALMCTWAPDFDKNTVDGPDDIHEN